MSKDALYQSLKQRINDGEWPAGQRMPSIRKLALEATFTYHVIVSAYMRLVSEGKDLSVETLARQANKIKQRREDEVDINKEDEVIISLR